MERRGPPRSRNPRRISFGLLNLIHRDGHAEPAALEPGQFYGVQIRLDDIAYRVPAGHRLRLAVSTAYWPMIWPAPEAAKVTVKLAGSRVQLPLRKAGGQQPVDIAPAKPVEPSGFELLRPSSSERRISHDVMTGETVVEHVDDSGLKRLHSHGIETGIAGRRRFGITEGDPFSAWATTHWTTETGRGDWRVRTESRSALRSDATTFHIEAELIGYEGDKEVFRHRWERAIARDHV